MRATEDGETDDLTKGSTPIHKEKHPYEACKNPQAQLFMLTRFISISI